MRKQVLAAVVLSGLFATAGCGGHSSHEADAGAMCALETRADSYSAGMAKMGSVGAVMMHLMEATPAPPAKGENTWKMMLMTAGGDPISGAELTATPFMPDHGHGATVKAVITDMGDGMYKVAPLDLFLDGYWTITFDVKAPGDVNDQVVFAFCVGS